ncbi:MAG: tetratricopeptide repeat protein, partial [Bryobacteraceae bacterium]
MGGSRIVLGLALLLATIKPNLWAQREPPPEVNQHLQSAQVYLDQEKYQEAARELRAAIAAYPQIRGAYYQLGFALFQTRQYVEAEKFFTKELTFQPPDPYSLYYLGRIRLDGGQRLRAVKYWEQSLQVGEVLDVRQRLATSYLALGRWDQTIQFLEASIAVRPEDGALHYLLGRAYKQKGKDAEAQAEFAATQRWKGKARLEMEGLMGLRKALAANNQNDAVRLTRELMESGDSEVLLAAGIALGGAGLHQEALPFLEKSSRLQSGLAEVHYNLGRAYLGLHDSTKA